MRPCWTCAMVLIAISFLRGDGTHQPAGGTVLRRGLFSRLLSGHCPFGWCRPIVPTEPTPTDLAQDTTASGGFGARRRSVGTPASSQGEFAAHPTPLRSAGLLLPP